MQLLHEKKEKAFVTYMTAGLPDADTTVELLKAQEEAGVDVVELGIPFSDPIADGPVIQQASYEAIQNGANLKNTFDIIKRARKEGCNVPVVFMIYYNAILRYGIERYVNDCVEAQVDGMIVPDLPKEEQKDLAGFMEGKEYPIIIQLVSPVSGERIPKIVKGARGFIYCVSTMGVTGQSGEFYDSINDYLKSVRNEADIPVMLGFGISHAKDVMPMKDYIDGAIVGSYFIKLLMENDYNLEKAKEYISTFRRELNE